MIDDHNTRDSRRGGSRRAELRGPGRGASKDGRDRVVGFFPGLGSGSSYQNLGRSLLDSGILEVVAIYRDGARALGVRGRPEKLLMVPDNMPRRRMARHGFIGAGLLVHSVGLQAHLRVAAEKRNAPLSFVAYAGESFGVIASAVVAGSLSVVDGVKIAHAFTPLMLVAAEGEDLDDPFARDMASYLPDSMRGRRLVEEPYHVVALKGGSEDLAEALGDIGRSCARADVEVHKLYSWRQTNVYVRAGAKPVFDLFMRKYPAVEARELKAPTMFVAHSERMRGVRLALERFIEQNDIVFGDPRVPVVSNNNSGLLTTAAQVRDGILAIADEVMASRATVETVDGLRPDLVVELGLGNKSVQLLTDNNVEAPVTAYTGPDDADLFFRAVALVAGVKEELGALHASGDRLEVRHYDMLGSLFRLASKNPFCERYFHRTMSRVITNAMLHSERSGSPAFYRFLEAYQHTYNHRDSIDVHRGELVLRARLKKRMAGARRGTGAGIRRVESARRDGGATDRSSMDVRQSEVVVFHFDRLAGLCSAELARKTKSLLHAEPSARRIRDAMVESLQIDGWSISGAGCDQAAVDRIVYQYGLFHVLRLHRPVVFAQSDYYLEGSDPLGWLVVLAASGALSLPDIVETYAAFPSGRQRLQRGAGRTGPYGVLAQAVQHPRHLA